MAGTTVSERPRQEMIKRQNNQERQEMTEQAFVCVLRALFTMFVGVCLCVTGGHAAVVPPLPGSTSSHLHHRCSTRRHGHRLQQGARTGETHSTGFHLCRFLYYIVYSH